MATRAAIGVWLLVVAGGMGALFLYSATPGRAANAPVRWPVVSLQAAADRPTLMMVVHPQCSCSRASLGELSRLMARLGDSVLPYVVFSTPEGAPERWDDSDLFDLADLVPGARVVRDTGRHIARAFDAQTSGQTYLYDRDGGLSFAGGITPTRSHMGDSIGRRRILALVEDGEADRTVSAVYGCPIEEE